MARSIAFFQYPRSDRAHCNCSTKPARLWPESTFSILGRIEPTATELLRQRDPLPETFQYPRSDRAHCNSAHPRYRHIGTRAFSILGRIEPTATGDLSPPSILVTPPFSILGRIEPTATCARPSIRPPGSTASFSILGRIEPTATPKLLDEIVEGEGLSVSSVGSSPLQPRPGAGDGGVLSAFQYPRSDRAHCNVYMFGAVSHDEGLFQYPRSDRAHCNQLVSLVARSISRFQYPRSDRAHCNASGGVPWSLPMALSVSSVGSSPLQPHLDC